LTTNESIKKLKGASRVSQAVRVPA
jgi:hypothetical protein